MLMAFMVGVVFNACTKKRGCTDEFSDNFDAEAEEDDDTCVEWRKKFVGKYGADGVLVETSTGGGPFVQLDDVGLVIEDQTVESPELILGFSNIVGQQFPLRGKVTSKWDLEIPGQSLGSFFYYGNAHMGGRVIDIHLVQVWITDQPDVLPNDTTWIHILGLRAPCCDCTNVRSFNYQVICEGSPGQTGQTWSQYRALMVSAGCICEE